MPPRSTGVTVTAPGFCTSPLTTYSRNSCMTKTFLSRRRSSCRLAQFLDEAGDGVARLRALADPVLGAVEFDREIFALLERIVSADLLDELAIAGTAAIGHDNAECRRVFRADPFHANFYRHKFFKRTWRIAVGMAYASLILRRKMLPAVYTSSIFFVNFLRQ